jgi:hypothetical protein
MKLWRGFLGVRRGRAAQGQAQLRGAAILIAVSCKSGNFWNGHVWSEVRGCEGGRLRAQRERFAEKGLAGRGGSLAFVRSQGGPWDREVRQSWNE